MYLLDTPLATSLDIVPNRIEVLLALLGLEQILYLMGREESHFSKLWDNA